MQGLMLVAALAAGPAADGLAERQAAEFEARVQTELEAVAPAAAADGRAAALAYVAGRWQEAQDA